jgi:lipoyl(octanoyl) transferase
MTTEPGDQQQSSDNLDALDVLDLGRMSYDRAYQTQLEIHQAVLQGHRADTLLIVEHDPVITVSRRRGAGAHLLATADQLADRGIEVHKTDRGGDVTYHGPGQLVVYPMIKLQTRRLNVRRYVCALEQSVIDALAKFSVLGRRVAGKPGIWVDGSAQACGEVSTSECTDKIAAVGVRIKRNVTMHGLALNVTTDLSHFDLIVPCGLSDCRAVSLESILGPETPSMGQVKDAMILVLSRNLKVEAST